MASERRQSSGIDNVEYSIDRRTLMKSLGATSAAAGLAGCGGDQDDENTETTDETDDGGGESQELGERVPEVRFQYYADAGNTPAAEATAPIFRDSVQDAIGASVSPEAVEFSTSIDNLYNDQRTREYSYWSSGASPDRLDPHGYVRRFCADWAGGNGNGNPAQYANCDYTDTFFESTSASNQEERRELIHDCLEIWSNDVVGAPLTTALSSGAYRPDAVDFPEGDVGVVTENAYAFPNVSTDLEEVVIAIDTPTVETLNYLTTSLLNMEVLFNQQFMSPLVQYDNTNELQNVLAENVEQVAADELVVELRDDIVFTNGDPITADDVKFTFEQMTRGLEAGAYPRATSPPLDEIEVIDDQSVRFLFEQNYLSFLTGELPRWGIVNQQHFEDAGAVESPGEPEFTVDGWVGSGPWEIADWERGQYIIAEPREDHPTTPEYTFVLQGFDSEESIVQSIGAGETHIAPGISFTGVERARENDGVVGSHQPSFFPAWAMAQYSHAPTKFEEFRKAVGACIDRNEINQIVQGGEGTPMLYSSIYWRNHPFHPDDEDGLYTMTDDESGDPERARNLLSEAGWAWDDDGNLHYPPDADLTPRWPEGEEPDPEDFPCLDDL